jgi:hypothetical protein
MVDRWTLNGERGKEGAAEVVASSEQHLGDYSNLISLHVTSFIVLLFHLINHIGNEQVIRWSLNYLPDYLVH